MAKNFRGWYSNVKLWIEETSTNRLMAIVGSAGFVLLAIWAVAIARPFDENEGAFITVTDRIVMSIGLLMWSLVGIIGLVRAEFFPVKGQLARFLGIVFCGLALYLAVSVWFWGK